MNKLVGQRGRKKGREEDKDRRDTLITTQTRGADKARARWKEKKEKSGRETKRESQRVREAEMNPVAFFRACC